MDDFNNYYDDYVLYRPDGVNIIGPIGIPGGQGPFGGGVPPFGQGGMFGPPFGQPPFGQGGFGPGGPGQSQFGQPSGPPPSFVPTQAAVKSFGGPSVYAIDPGAIRRCMYKFVYLWLENGRSFWAWLTFVGRESVAGWRWNGFRWVYFGMDLDRIESFYCY